jgi:hypothetical protein
VDHCGSLGGGIWRSDCTTLEAIISDGDRTGQLLFSWTMCASTRRWDMPRTTGRRAWQARLIAEKSQAGSVEFPGDLLARQPQPRVAESIQREIALFNARRSALESQVTLMQAQIRDVELEVKGLTEQLNAETTAASYAKEELQANEALIERKFIANTRLLASARWQITRPGRASTWLKSPRPGRKRPTWNSGFSA